MRVTTRVEVAPAVTVTGDPSVVLAVGAVMVTVGTADATPHSSSAQTTSMSLRGTPCILPPQDEWLCFGTEESTAQWRRDQLGERSMALEVLHLATLAGS